MQAFFAQKFTNFKGDTYSVLLKLILAILPSKWFFYEILIPNSMAFLLNLKHIYNWTFGNRLPFQFPSCPSRRDCRMAACLAELHGVIHVCGGFNGREAIPQGVHQCLYTVTQYIQQFWMVGMLKPGWNSKQIWFQTLVAWFSVWSFCGLLLSFHVNRGFVGGFQIHRHTFPRFADASCRYGVCGYANRRR